MLRVTIKFGGVCKTFRLFPMQFYFEIHIN